MKAFLISILAVGMFFSSCGNTKSIKENNFVITNNNTADSTTIEHHLMIDKASPDVYFMANGTEPFWGLSISKNTIQLKTIGDSITMPHSNPERAQDTNFIRYALHSEKGMLNIQIKQSECINAMSGMASPYIVNIEFKTDNKTAPAKLEGCGKYITDYRLHDIWVLETLNGNMVTNENRKNELPLMEINSASNRFTGYSGCNRMNGTLFFEMGVLRFKDILTTKMACHDNLENEFLKALKSATAYKIENNRLWLSSPTANVATLKKID